MDCNDYKNRIVPYIDNELGDLDKKEFESELEKNSKLKEEYLEIKGLLHSLSDLPRINAPSNFIVSLNEKIDAYELSKERGWNVFIDNIFKSNYFARASVVAMSFVFIFSLFYFCNSDSYNSSSFILSNSDSTVNNPINSEIADIDSLEIEEDIDD